MIERANEYLARLGREGFFGTIEFQFNNGNIVFVREVKTIKPSDLK